MKECRMIQVVGARGTIRDVTNFLARVREFSQHFHCVIQVFDATVIYGAEHLDSAVTHALRAMKRKTNTTNSLEMEILLYASGERQLKLAIPKMGVKQGKGTIVVVFFHEIEKNSGGVSDRAIDDMLHSLSFVRDDSVVMGNEDTLRNFGITDEEFKTVTKAKYGHLILEKIALVDIIK